MTPPMLRSTVATLLIALWASAATPTQAAEWRGWGDRKGWDVRENLLTGGCEATRSFPAASMRYSVQPSGDHRLAISLSSQTLESGVVKLTFDGSRSYDVDGSVVRDGVTLDSLKPEVVAEFENAGSATLSESGSSPIQLPLAGTAAAGAALRDCANVTLETKAIFARLKQGVPSVGPKIIRSAQMPEIDYGGIFVRSRDRAGEMEDFSTSILATGDVAVTGMTWTFGEGTQSRNIALVIDNSEYEYVPDLAAPGSDAELVSDALRARGFKVLRGSNVSQTDLDELIYDLRSEPKLGMLLVYYAGHGAAINGRNSLLMAGFNPNDVSDSDYVGMDNLLSRIADLHFSSYLFAFDACRTVLNVPEAAAPIIKSADNSSLRGISMQEVDSDALVSVEYAISFSAGEGQVAQDRGTDGYSPYASAFARLFRNSKTVTDALLGLRREVLAATGQKQNPAVMLRWGDDVSLEASRASSVSVTFPDIVGRYVVATSKDLTEFHTAADPHAYAPVPAVHLTFDAAQTAELAREAFSDVTADLSANQVGNDVLISWDRFRHGPGMNRSALMKKITGRYPDQTIFEMNSSFELDGTFVVDGTMEVDVDIDSDGLPEQLLLSSYRGGATLTFTSGDSSFNADGMISPSAEAVYVFDYSKDGVADYVVGYEGWFVVLDGARLIDLADHPLSLRTYERVENALSRWFETKLASWCADGSCSYRFPVLGPMGDAVLFFDLGRLDGRIQEGALTYRGGDTWDTKYDQNVILEKRARFDRATRETRLDTDWKDYQGLSVPVVWSME